MSRPPSRKKNWNQLSQFWRISTKVIPNIAWTTPAPSFLKEGGSKSWLLPVEGGNLKNLKRTWKYGAEASLLKRGSWHFSYLIFSKFIIFTFRNYFTLCKIVLCILRKIIFFYHHNFIKKFILSCLKMNLKISHKSR